MLKSRFLQPILAIGTMVAMLATLVATIIPAAAVASPSGVGADFYGWNLSSRTPAYPNWSGDWTKGNLGQLYQEGDWVSYVFILTNSSSDTITMEDITGTASWGNIYYDFFNSSKDAIFVDLLRNFRYVVQNPIGGSGKPDNTVINPATNLAAGAAFAPTHLNEPFPSGTAETAAVPAAKHYFSLDGGLPATLASGKSLLIYFEAHLSQTFVWGAGQEYLFSGLTTQGGARYTDWTAIHNGSGFTSGSSPHFNYDAPGFGVITVPIPIARQPGASISGVKFNDINQNGVNDNEPLLGGWVINLRVTIEGIEFVRVATTAPVTGAYSFIGLPPGTYSIHEVMQSGWIRTTPVSDPFTVIISANTLAASVDFGNFQLAPAMTLTKSASPTSFTAPGEVTYTYVITNTGNVELTGLTLNDDLAGVVPLNVSTLAPGASTTATKTYAITQDMINAGTPIVNIATADSDQTPPVTATATVTVGQNPAMTLTKAASPTSFSAPGEVTYTYVITNTGNVELTGLTLNDDLAGIVTLSVSTLAPGASTTATKTYAITQDMINAGTPIVNVATADSDQTEPVTATATVTVAGCPPVECPPVECPPVECPPVECPPVECPPDPELSGNIIGTIASEPTPTGATDEYNFLINIDGELVCVATTTLDYPDLLTLGIGATLTGTLDNSRGWWVLTP